MRLVTYIILITLSVVIIGSSCQTKKRKLANKYEEFKNKTINLPLIDNDSNKKVKIVTFVDGECGKCVELLRLWKPYIKKYSTDINFLIYFYSIDQMTMDFIDSAIINLKYPMIHDPEKQFLSLNNIEEKEKLFHTFLLNKKDQVQLIGAPYLNQKNDSLYNLMIERMLQDE